MTSSSEQTTALNPYTADTRAVMHPGIAHQFGEGFLPALLPWLAMAWENGRGAAKPRVVSTVAELDTLPFDSVVISNEGGIWQRLVDGWYEPASKLPVQAFDITVPATVLWVGGTE